MLTQLEMEKRNLESSLLFMQQEHSNTLKALHEEISNLQKRCTELTFQLTMQGLDDTGTDKKENEKKVSELQGLLNECEKKQSQLEQQVEQKDLAMKELKQKLLQNERSYIDELKSRNHQVLTLRVELDTKSKTIAALTAEIHKLKVVRSSREEPLPRTPPSREREGSGKLKARRVPSASAADIQSRPITAKTKQPAPDAEVFLARNVVVEEPNKEVAMKPTPPILPPIAAAGYEDVKAFTRRQKMIRRRIDLNSQGAEYTTLAVDQLVSSSNSNTYIHEPNTTK